MNAGAKNGFQGLCGRCGGTVYPRQCRNSAAWRAAQRAPEVCPHGIALNNLPIGDNSPVGEVPKLKWRPRCRWGRKVSCCHIFCENLEVGYLMPDEFWRAAHCTPDNCDHYEEEK